MFDYNASDRKIYVPYASVDTYKAVSYWSDYADYLVAYDFEKGEVVEIIPETWKIYYTATAKVEPNNKNAFGANIISNTYENGKGLITFDGPVTLIGDFAFFNCSSLSSITIPNNVTSIESYAFRDCSSLMCVTIPNSVSKIGYQAFSGCVSMKDVCYAGDLSAWCKFDFSDPYANPLYYTAKLYLNGLELTEVSIPSNITVIKQYTFNGCTSLTNVILHNRITSIGECAFRSCSSLSNVTIPDNDISIENHAFDGCSSLACVTIPDSVTSIGESAFEYCI